MRNILFLIYSLTLISCANTVDAVSNEPLDGTYRVVEIKGEKALDDDIIFNFNPVGNRVSGNLGCNEFSALYTQQGRNLEFSVPMNTRKYCEGKMEVEKQILTSLENASRVDKKEDQIIVYSNSDTPIMILNKID